MGELTVEQRLAALEEQVRRIEEKLIALSARVGDPPSPRDR